MTTFLFWMPGGCAFSGRSRVGFRRGSSFLSLLQLSAVHLRKVRDTRLPNILVSGPPSSVIFLTLALPGIRNLFSILLFKNSPQKIPSSRTRHQRSPRFHELAYFTISLHYKSISLTRCHDFSPLAPPTPRRARPLDRLTSGVNSPSNHLRPPLLGYPKVRKVIPPGSPGGLPHRTLDPPFTPPMGSSRLGLPPSNHSPPVASPLHALFGLSAFRTPLSLVGINVRSQNRRGSVTRYTLKSGPARRLLE